MAWTWTCTPVPASSLRKIQRARRVDLAVDARRGHLPFEVVNVVRLEDRPFEWPVSEDAIGEHDEIGGVFRPIERRNDGTPPLRVAHALQLDRARGTHRRLTVLV